VTLVPLGLLIEEQRTNLLLQSQTFDNAAWTKNRSSISANAATAPDGTNTAEKLIEDTATNTHFINQTQTTTASTHIFSCYLKAGERSWATLYVSGANVGQYFNLSTGTVGSTFVGAPTSASIISVGNGWYRCAITFTSTTSSDGRIYVAAGDANNSYTGNGTSGIYIWGAQLEAGAFATSYIPTVASTVTRAADTAVIAAPMFAPWYSQTEGTFIAEASTITATSNRILDASAGVGSRVVDLLVVTSAGANIQFYNGTTVFTTLNALTLGAPFKTAAAYKTADYAVVLNGGAPVTNSAVLVNTANALQIGRISTGTSHLNGHLRSINYYPLRLTNAQLQGLTT
jgi:hypothetical protein